MEFYSFDLTGATVGWAWTPEDPTPPPPPRLPGCPIEVVRLDSGATIVASLPDNHPLLTDDWLAYYSGTEMAIYLHRFSDRDASPGENNCDNVAWDSDPAVELALFDLSNEYLLYRCLNAPYTAYRLADGSKQALYNAYGTPLLSGSPGLL